MQGPIHSDDKPKTDLPLLGQLPVQLGQGPVPSIPPPGPVPFAPFGGTPPFRMPPPAFPPQSFSMVPPPWGIPPGVPPPTGVPPPVLQFDHLALSQVDPKVVAKAFEWTEHTSPDGKIYYFNAKTQASVWEKPAALIEFEGNILVEGLYRLKFLLNFILN